MADDAIDSGLFNISLSDSDDGNENGQTSSVTRDRTGQTEEKFQEVKRDFRAKIENGEIWKSFEVPLGRRKVPKHEAQELLHAVEELYFYKRFDEGITFIGRMLEGDGGGDGLDGEVKEILRTYEIKCRRKLGQDTA